MILPPPHGPGDEDRIRADQATMAAIAEGEQAAFARVVAAETPRLLRFVRSLVSASPAEAEEIVQEALLRLWRNAGDWQPSGRIGTWLHQVAYRLSIDAIRRRRPSVDIDSVADDLADAAPAPDARLARLDDARAIRSAIERLPARQRTAVILCHFQGLGQAEAAAVMGVGEHAYESLLARARRRLRAEFTRADGGGGGS